MNDTVMRVAMVAGVLAAFIALEFALGRFPTREVSRRNNWLDFAAFAQATFLAGPLIAYGTALIETRIFPGHAGIWSGAPWWLQLAAFLVCEDMVQYWYHRLSHKYTWLWPAHKFHHTPEYMGVRVIWRNSFFYDLLMPNIWLAGVLVYLGFGKVFFWYNLVKLFVTMGAHSTTRWDAFLYRHQALHPLAWIVERTISTPATHFAHHAYAEDDGIGHYSGNFGNLLFFWDVLFGTARITRKYPPRFGVPGEPDSWQTLIFYPLVRAPDRQDRA